MLMIVGFDVYVKRLSADLDTENTPASSEVYKDADKLWNAVDQKPEDRSRIRIM